MPNRFGQIYLEVSDPNPPSHGDVLACLQFMIGLTPLTAHSLLCHHQCQSLLVTMLTLAFAVSSLSLQSFKHPGSHWLHSTFRRPELFYRTIRARLVRKMYAGCEPASAFDLGLR